MKIIYIGSYSHEKYKNDYRIVYPSSQTKCAYITKTLKNIGYDVSIVSCSRTDKRSGFVKRRRDVNEDGVSYVLSPTFGVKTKFGIVLQKLFSRLWMFFYLLKNANRKTIVISYHTISSISPISFSRFFKRYQLVLEVEEIYGSFDNVSKSKKKKELKFLDSPHKYIFACESLADTINHSGKPSIISYGSYLPSSPRREANSNGIIRVVYAGTFDPVKGGCKNAILAASYLPAMFHVHILGFGTKEETAKVIKSIEEFEPNGGAEVFYDGCLLGEEYDSFLSKCSIGLSTQSMSGSFNSTSFPSKILVYLSHDLKVVSPALKVIKESKLNNNVIVYENDNPKSIAEAIIRANSTNMPSGADLIDKLDKEFSLDIAKMLEA